MLDGRIGCQLLSQEMLQASNTQRCYLLTMIYTENPDRDILNLKMRGSEGSQYGLKMCRQ